MTQPFLLRRRKVDPDVLPDLPPRQDSTEFCTLTVEQAALYQATIDAMMADVRGAAGIERRGHVLALITRLKQVCNHPLHAMGKPGALTGRSGKLDRLTEMLSEALAEGDSALVFTQYAVMGGLLVGAHRARARGRAALPRRVDAADGPRAASSTGSRSRAATRGCSSCRCAPAASGST